jgi:hypothetical protein
MILPVLLVLASCASVPTYPVGTDIFDERLETSVDSPLAKYYLEQYIQGHNTDPLLHARIDALYQSQAGRVPTRDELKTLADQYSVDFAAIFFAEHVHAQEENRAIQQAFNDYLGNGGTAPGLRQADLDKYLFLFVPGWDYVENGHITGADFAVQRILFTAFGAENHLVTIPPHGSVVENADVLTGAIELHGGKGKSIVLVGASSAGPSIYLALAENRQNPSFGHVKGWLNIGGILYGSPVIDYYQVWPRRWFFNVAVWSQGWDRDRILSLSTVESRKRMARLTGIDPDILIINYIGLPLSGAVSPYAADYYSKLAAEGPNDGLSFLPDMVAPDSLTIIAPGRDHFLAEDPMINDKTIAMLKVVIAYLEHRSQLD